ncbi:WYL domain-containing protein [Ruania suaedae]|uniref:DUF4037 domain-containing protein n=1 Tax=Ruania suaedae TaxID=2897774 RepID=UPI001E439F61|nr:WYL domain-containing protein [Ruania suaedae]UFU04520.1 WYL domain-containing protein [Ruania suaedae]
MAETERGTTERVLALLGMLQRRQIWTGPELAEALGVTVRTVRRDVERLRSLGYLVEASQGLGGGYRLHAGRELPPLMLDDGEATAIAVALLSRAQAGERGAADAALGALTKLHRVLPARLRDQVAALHRAVDFFDGAGDPVDAGALMVLAGACRDRHQVGFGYSRSDHEAPQERRVEPYRLVTSERRWYLLAYDLDRDDWRTFRVDRMSEVAARTWRFAPRQAPDAARFVQEGVTGRAYRRQARFLVDAPAEQVRRQIPARAAVVLARGPRSEVRAGADDLDYVLLHVAMLGHEFEVLEPADLAERAGEVARRLGRAGDRPRRPAPATPAGPDGLALARRYYEEIVAPLLMQRWPGLPHAAARLGSGSDVLGLDDAMSRDHDWGLRLTLLVEDAMAPEVEAYLGETLPDAFLGLPTRFAFSGHTEPAHHIEVASPSRFVIHGLGFDPRGEVSAEDWLSLTGQAVLEIVAGPVFHDGTGEITALRSALRWYPDDLWRHVVAADWARLAEEMPLMSRAGDAGDDLGSRVIAARLVDVAMHLSFTLSRQWMPYAKWRGTMLGRLPGMDGVHQHLRAVLGAAGWRERQECLAGALDLLLERQQEAGLPAPRPATTGFWDRPYRVAREEISAALLAGVSDPAVRALPPGRGSAEQISDNVAVLLDPARRLALVGRTGLADH